MTFCMLETNLLSSTVDEASRESSNNSTKTWLAIQPFSNAILRICLLSSLKPKVLLFVELSMVSKLDVRSKMLTLKLKYCDVRYSSRRMNKTTVLVYRS